MSIVLWLRRIAATPFVPLLFIMLLVGGVLTAVTVPVTDEATVKGWVEETGIYENATDVAVDTVFQHTNQTLEDGNDTRSATDVLAVATTEEELKEIASRVFPPSWIRRQVEGAVDAVYAFLKDETDTVEITVNVSSRHDEAQEELTVLFQEQFSELPPCENGNTTLDAGTLEEFNLFEAECRPPGVPLSVVNTTIANASASIPLPESQTITSEDWAISAEDLGRVQTAFTVAEYAPLIFLLAALLFTLLIHVTRPGTTWRASGVTWMAAGALLVVAGGVALTQFDAVFGYATAQLPGLPEAALALVQNLVQVIYRDIVTNVLLVGLALIFIGSVFTFHARYRALLTALRDRLNRSTAEEDTADDRALAPGSGEERSP